MPALARFWSRSVSLLGTSLAPQPSRKTRRRPPARRRRFEQLEDRTVLSATFGSALSIGTDTGSSRAYDLATDQAGNSYVTGYFTGMLDFDEAAAHPGDADILTSRGTNDAYIAKYASDNSLVWVRRMGGDTLDSRFPETGDKIAVDPGGNVYVSGNFYDTGDFGATTLTSAGNTDVFVTKLDATGSILWAKRWGTTEQDRAQGVGVDAAGNVYALGLRTNDNFELPKHDVLKFSASGATVWTRSIATGGQTILADMTVSAPGNVFVVGSFRGNVDFDPGPKAKYVSSGLGKAGFALKLSTTGSFNWVSPFVVQQSGAFSQANSVAIDSSENVFVGGSYYGSIDFKPGSGSVTLPTSWGGYITKLNSTGGLVWARALESDSSMTVYGLAVDAAGAIYATGALRGTVDFDPGAGTYSRTTAGGNDVFVVKLTSAGNFSWAETFGAAEDDIGFGITVDTTGAVRVAGSFRGTVDFDPDPLATHLLTGSETLQNGFLLKLLQS